MPDSRIDKASVAVVVPMYKAEINADEAKSLESICRVLAARDIIVVKPRGLDLSALLAPYPGIRQIEFDPSFFQGIRGYNRLMTSAAFYDTFASYQYILIAQLDTYIFRDDLDTWCARGFDYVGAPWLRRTVNRFPPMLWIKRIEDALRRRKGLYSKTALYNRVGNGGLSLRKTASHARVCREKADELARLNAIGPKGHPEDVFWATDAPGFTYPTAKEALMFAFDKYPAWCYRLTGRQLPMGCHGWTSRKMRPFWSKIF